MKILLRAILMLSLPISAFSEEITFPAKSGEYHHKGWRYTYSIELKGTRSEKRIGRLFLNGKEVKGEIGELHQEPFGILLYFGDGGYNQGWLNTMTYDQEVFGEGGIPTPEVALLLRNIRATKGQKKKHNRVGGRF